jgi:CRP-like cAMP-binding protein
MQPGTLLTQGPCSPKQNHLLAALSAAECERIYPHLEQVEMSVGHILCESGSRASYVHFPIDSIVSLVQITKDGASTEIAAVGNEGVVGVALFMGGDSTPTRAVVRSAGRAFRLKADLVKKEFARGGVMNELILRYTQALLTQMAQTAVCNRYHWLEQQLCRWLLLSLDRLQSNELHMTQELIANTLGVRREGVTEAAGKLQDLGLIRYRRGHITVVDRPGLEAKACECYAVVKAEFNRLLPAQHTHAEPDVNIGSMPLPTPGSNVRSLRI